MNTYKYINLLFLITFEKDICFDNENIHFYGFCILKIPLNN
jgi:hypothetical protein